MDFTEKNAFFSDRITFDFTRELLRCVFTNELKQRFINRTLDFLRTQLQL